MSIICLFFICRGTKLIEDVIIGANTSVSEHSQINSSVIGRNCKIGKNCTINNSFILDNTTIGDNADISYTVIGSNSSIKPNVKLSESCIIGANVQIDKDQSLSNTLIQSNKPDNGNNWNLQKVKLLKCFVKIIIIWNYYFSSNGR